MAKKGQFGVGTPVDDPNLLGKNVIPCTVCGTPTDMLGTKLCNGCWSISTNLRSILPNAQARQWLRNELKPYDTQDGYQKLPRRGKCGINYHADDCECQGAGGDR